MRTFPSILGIVVLLALLSGAGVARAADTLIADEQPSRIVGVRDVTTRNGVVSGTLVNRSRKPLRDVRLLVHHTWFWKNEQKPGDDSPGRVDYYTAHGELRPDGSVEFTYRPAPPLPDRDDGHFETTVEVVGWTEIGR
ncbi:MAG: hypothetical protein HY271_02810 [Deltaproteobacteria bacterium]|nr:hypothetical protein [Deltaproteobacteria bacterium]